MESLNKRIASVLIEKAKTKRQAQMEMEREQKPKEDPKVKLLDHLYECLSDEDCKGAMECLHKLTSSLKLEDEVSFDMPESEEGDEEHESEEGEPQERSIKEPPTHMQRDREDVRDREDNGDHEFR